MAGILDFPFDPDEPEAPLRGLLAVRGVRSRLFDSSAGTSIPEDVPFGLGGPSQAPFRPMPLWPSQLFLNSPGDRGQLPDKSPTRLPDRLQDRRLGGRFGVGPPPMSNPGGWLPVQVTTASPRLNPSDDPSVFNLPPDFGARPDASRLKLPGSVFSAAPAQSDAGANRSTSADAVQSDVAREAEPGPKPFEPLIPYWAGAFADGGLASRRNWPSRAVGKNWVGAAREEMPAGGDLITPMSQTSAQQISPLSDPNDDNDLGPQQARAEPGSVKTETVLEFLGARQAADGNLYIPDPTRPGKYLVLQSRAALPEGIDPVVTPPDVLAETRTKLADALHGIFVQPLVDAYDAATGKMTEDEARDFAIQTIIGSIGPVGIGGRAAIRAAEGVARAPVRSVATKPKIFSPPDKPPRPFSADYPQGARTGAGGKLAEDIEGRPLHARYVAGRRVPGGPDEPLTPVEIVRLIYELTGDLPKHAQPSVMGRRLGATVFRDGLPPRIYYKEGLSGQDLYQVLAHETGHVLDEAARIPARARKELTEVYSTLKTGKEGLSPPKGPRDLQYPLAQVPDELKAEGLRAYLTNPNYFKTVAPKAAANFRAAINSHEDLSKILQLNTIAAVAGAQLLPVDNDPFARTGEPEATH